MIAEERSGEQPYHYEYAYDQGGNRTKKTRHVDVSVRIEDRYHYDVDADPRGSYGSDNNRLMYYETFETCRVFEDYDYDGSCGTEDLVSTTWYHHGQSSNPWYIVTEKEVPEPEEPQFTGTQLHHASNGRAVIFALGISWNSG